MTPTITSESLRPTLERSGVRFNANIPYVQTYHTCHDAVHPHLHVTIGTLVRSLHTRPNACGGAQEAHDRAQ